MNHGTSALYDLLHTVGVMVPYLGIALFLGLYIVVALGALRTLPNPPRWRPALDKPFALVVVAFIPLCVVHRWFLTFVGLDPDGFWGLVVLAALSVASWSALVALALTYRSGRTRVAEAVTAGHRASVAEAASRAIIEALPIPAVYIAPGREIVGATYEDVNAAACEVWNRSREELTSEPYDTFVADDPEATRAAAEAVDAGGSVDGFTSTYTVPERAPVTQRWLEIKGTGWWIALPINAEVRARAEAERFASLAHSADRKAKASELELAAFRRLDA